MYNKSARSVHRAVSRERHIRREKETGRRDKEEITRAAELLVAIDSSKLVLFLFFAPFSFRALFHPVFFYALLPTLDKVNIIYFRILPGYPPLPFCLQAQRRSFSIYCSWKEGYGRDFIPTYLPVFREVSTKGTRRRSLWRKSLCSRSEVGLEKMAGRCEGGEI